MRILLVNDDGIQADGLRALAEEAIGRGHEVFISAPLHQQSAASHRITLHQPLMLSPHKWPGATAWAVDGSPADCVRLALGNLIEGGVDFCLSGINDGYNAGVAAYYSGTVSAAREASMLGVRAMAVSCDFHPKADSLRRTAALALDIAQRAARMPARPMWLINLNVPDAPEDGSKPVTAAPLSRACYHDRYEQRVSPFGHTYFWLSADPALDPPEAGSDLALLHSGFPTCTFMGEYAENNPDIAPFLQD